MPEIIWEGHPSGKWLPALNQILMPSEPYYKERAPMVAAHEIGHWKYDQTLGDSDPLIDMMQERDAWRFALDKLPPGEIDLDFLERELDGYIQNVEEWYGRGRELDFAQRMKAEVLYSAKSKRGEIDW